MDDGGFIADDESNKSDRDGAGVEDELDDDLAHLNDLDVTRGFDLDAFVHENRQHAPAAGDAGDGKAETIGSSFGSAVNDLGPAREGGKPDERFVSRGRGGPLLGPGREGRKRPQRSINFRHRPRKQ